VKNWFQAFAFTRVNLYRYNSDDKEFIAKSKERMEQRNVQQHKHHITRLNVVGGGFEEYGAGGRGGGTSVGTGMTPSEKQQRIARAAAEAAEARAVGVVFYCVLQADE
jgi:hypothetical protein